MELHNLYSIDIFLQGFFLLTCLSSGFYLLFSDNIESAKNVTNIQKFSLRMNELMSQFLNVVSLKVNADTGSKKFGFLGLLPFAIGAIFICGITGFGFADKWIDSDTHNHLWLKDTWKQGATTNEEINYHALKINPNQAKFKDLIRIKAFQTVFNLKPDSLKKFGSNNIHQLYFHAKHETLQNPKSYNYIRKSQSLSEYTRTFALGFFFLIITGFLNLIIMIYRVIRQDKAPKNQNPLSTSAVKTEKLNEENTDVHNESQKPTISVTGKGKELLTISNSIIILFSILSVFTILMFSAPKLVKCSLDGILAIQLILIFFGCATFLVFLIKKFRPLKFSFFTYSLLYVISVSGYISCSKLWVANEIKVSKKIFGLYKSNHLSPQVKEIKMAKEMLKLDHLTEE